MPDANDNLYNDNSYPTLTQNQPQKKNQDKNAKSYYNKIIHLNAFLFVKKYFNYFALSCSFIFFDKS
jgi:hypothetical protein